MIQDKTANVRIYATEVPASGEVMTGEILMMQQTGNLNRKTFFYNKEHYGSPCIFLEKNGLKVKPMLAIKKQRNMGAVLVATVMLWCFKDPGVPGGIWVFEKEGKMRRWLENCFGFLFLKAGSLLSLGCKNRGAGI